MFRFLFSWFIGQKGPKISRTITQIVPNLRLAISSARNKPDGESPACIWGPSLWWGWTGAAFAPRAPGRPAPTGAGSGCAPRWARASPSFSFSWIRRQFHNVLDLMKNLDFCTWLNTGRVTVVVSDYILLTLFLKLLKVVALLSNFCPICSCPS